MMLPTTFMVTVYCVYCRLRWSLNRYQVPGYST